MLAAQWITCQLALVKPRKPCDHSSEFLRSPTRMLGRGSNACVSNGSRDALIRSVAESRRVLRTRTVVEIFLRSKSAKT